VNLHDHIGGKDTKKVKSEMSSLGNCSWHMFDFLILLCSVALRDLAFVAPIFISYRRDGTKDSTEAIATEYDTPRRLQGSIEIQNRGSCNFIS
jgi:hypothetical protein